MYCPVGYRGVTTNAAWNVGETAGDNFPVERLTRHSSNKLGQYNLNAPSVETDKYFVPFVPNIVWLL